MAFSKLTGKGIDLTTNVITQFNSTGIDDNATSTAITIAANNSVAIPNLHGNTTTVGNLTVGGDFIVQGNNFTVDADSLRVEDSLIQLASNNESSDVIDIGFFGHYSNDGNTALHTGFFRDASDEQYYLFNGLEDANLNANNSVTTINRSGTGFTLASLNIGALNVNSGATNISAIFESTDGIGGIQLKDNSGNVELTTTAGNFEVRPAGGSPIAVFSANGFVGIGTSSPDYSFVVQGDNNINDNIFAVKDSDGTRMMSVEQTSNGDGRIFTYDTSGSAKVLLHSNGTSYFNGGNVAFGSTSSTNLLTINANTGSTPTVYINNGSPNATEGLALKVQASGRGSGIADVSIFSVHNNTDELFAVRNDGVLLVDTTQHRPATNNVDGVSIDSTVGIEVSITNGGPLTLNRKSSNGSIASFKKDGTTIGNIGSEGGDSIYIGNGDTGLKFSGGADAIQPFDTSTVAARDAAIDLGTSGARFKNLYLSGNMVVGASGSTYSAGALGYSDANWGFIYRPPQAGGTGAHLFEAYDGTDLVRIQENGDIKLGNANARVTSSHNIPNTGGSALWIRLGTFAASQAGRNLYIKIIANQGYNASNSQDGETYIRFKTGNNASFVTGTGSSGNFYANGRFYQFGNSTVPGTVRAVQNSLSEYEIWGLFSNFTGASFYEVSYDVNSTWTHSGTTSTQASPPVGGGTLAYLDLTRSFRFSTDGSFHPEDGKGIDFSQDANASGATSEILDDYEEGTWTPTTPNGSWSVSEATYTKIGRLVFCRARVQATSAISSADFSGLPFTVLNSYSAGSVGYQNSVSSTTFNVLVQANSHFNFRVGATQYGLNNGAQAMFSFVYETSD